jgi:putative mRNA 3-end processing factor
MAVELRKQGLHLTGTSLWLDARRKSELSFVSHAHADHIARHERVIATGPTVEMMRHRLGQLPAALPAPYNRPFDLGPLGVELLPAGHMLGSAQIRITRPDGHRVVYTGDLNLEPSLTAEAAQVAQCDTLVMESTFGAPRFRFPPRAQVLDELEGWVRSRLAQGITPVLLGYPYGKSQEVIRVFNQRQLPVVAHPKIHEVAQLYGRLGVPLECRRFDGEVQPGEVAVFPPFRAAAALARIPRRATAVLTGWALESWGARRYGADVAFPLSDHADCASLVRYAQESGAEEVLTTHGFAEELAEELKRAGIFARPVGKPVQLDLAF